MILIRRSGKISWEPIEVKDLKRIGIKFNPEMVELIEKRIKEAKEAGRGLNILVEGNVKKGYGKISSRHGKEYSHTLYADGEINILPWDPEKAYRGKHHFWLEGFEKR